MVSRSFWIEQVERAWKRRSVVWLSGVRRVGKTFLCQTLPSIDYFDCELPSVRRQLSEPERFLEECRGKRIVLDEVHRLDNPSELLKIAADHFQGTRILATASSTLSASAKFRDTLTGRKTEILLTPMILKDLLDFERPNLSHRLLRGGLPPFFLAEDLPERDFQEWMDAYWAKDIQELFRLERRHSFQRLAELLFVQSGGIFEASRLARPCEVSRTTISNYLAVLEATHVVHVIHPYAASASAEIVSAPKVYAFDTGFICYYRGWSLLRHDDLGILWEHVVLNEIQARLQTSDINYWRDKRGHEVDFVLARRGRDPIAIECKWTATDLDPTGLAAFHRRYPRSRLFVVTSDERRARQKTAGGVEVTVTNLATLMDALSHGSANNGR